MITEIQGLQGLSAVNSVRIAKSSENTEIPQAEQSAPNVDEYIPSEERESAGLYRVSANEQGNPEVKFAVPKTAESNETTVNTDSVDRELELLKNKQTELQKQLKSASSDEAEELWRQLEQISAELALKNNDSYRKANSVIS